MEAVKMKVLMELAGPGGKYEIGQDTWKMGMPGAERDVTHKCFVKGPRTLREFFDDAFKSHWDKVFLVHADDRLTFGQVWKRVCSVATSLVNNFGVRAGDRVAISMRNLPEWCEAFIAATSIGAVAVPLNSWWKGAELEYGLRDSGAKVLFCDQERYNHVRSVLGDTKVVLCRPSAPIDSTVPTYASLLSTPATTCPSYPTAHDSYAAIMYTSGTTGHPKGVVLTHRGIMNQMISSILLTEVMTRLEGPKKEQECMICPVPLFHVTACHHIFLTCLGLGRKLVFMKKWDPAEALKLIERERATHWTGVPTMIQDMMEHPNFKNTDISSLRMVGGGGAPTPTSQVEKSSRKFKTAAPSQGYGLTETNGGVAFIQGDLYKAKPFSTGTPHPVAEFIIVDTETGEVLENGKGHRGEILIKSPLNFSHYWNKAEATNSAVIEVKGKGYGWFRTGDVGEIDGEGFLFIRDRAKDLIIRGGENISCSEVESAFHEACQDIHECACFAVKDQRLGEAVGIVIHTRNNTSLDTGKLLKDVSKNLANFKMPEARYVFYTNEPLPRGATGKILKRVIRDHYNKLVESHKAKM